MIRTPKCPQRLRVTNNVVYRRRAVDGREVVAAMVDRDINDDWLAYDEHGSEIGGPFPARARALDAARAHAEELRP